MISVAKQIENIMSNNLGKIFSINDFYNLATKNTIKSILYRLSEDDTIIRMLDGLHTEPRYSEILQEYSYPNINAAIIKKDL